MEKVYKTNETLKKLDELVSNNQTILKTLKDIKLKNYHILEIIRKIDKKHLKYAENKLKIDLSNPSNSFKKEEKELSPKQFTMNPSKFQRLKSDSKKTITEYLQDCCRNNKMTLESNPAKKINNYVSSLSPEPKAYEPHAKIVLRRLRNERMQSGVFAKREEKNSLTPNCRKKSPGFVKRSKERADTHTKFDSSKESEYGLLTSFERKDDEKSVRYM